MRRDSNLLDRSLIPPDEGWSWMICFAFALNNAINLPLISCFGLIFQYTFAKYEISAMSGSFILNLNQAVTMIFAIYSRYYMKKYGYRKMATVGALLIFIGVILTSNATNTFYYIVTYGLIVAVGVALSVESFSLAISSYFNVYLETVLTVGVLFAGLGPIFIPFIINLLMTNYGPKWTIAILGALSMHSFVAALLLRPIKWYKKPSLVLKNDHGKIQIKENESKELEMKDLGRENEYFTDSELDYYDEENQSFSGSLQTKIEVENVNEEQSTVLANKSNESEPLQKIKYPWWKSTSTVVNLSSSVDIFNDIEKKHSHSNVTQILTPDENVNVNNNHKEAEVTHENNRTEQTKKRSIEHEVRKALKEDFMKDPQFLSIIFGISLASSADVNFNLLMPFMLSDLNFTIEHIAIILAITAFSDFIFRFISPFIGEWCRKSARVMYLMSLCMLIFTRTTFYFASSYEVMLFIAVGLGIAKGVRSAYIDIIIPNYVSLEKCKAASNIQIVINGIILIIIGTILGHLRDATESYKISIIVINVLTFITIILWSLEYIYVRYTAKN